MTLIRSSIYIYRIIYLQLRHRLGGIQTLLGCFGSPFLCFFNGIRWHGYNKIAGKSLKTGCRIYAKKSGKTSLLWHEFFTHVSRVFHALLTGFSRPFHGLRLQTCCTRNFTCELQNYIQIWNPTKVSIPWSKFDGEDWIIRSIIGLLSYVVLQWL